MREPNHISSIRETRWKIARYYDPSGVYPTEWEMYDLQRDPNERANLAYPGQKLSTLHRRQLKRLKAKLAKVEKNRLATLAQAARHSASSPSGSRVTLPAATSSASSAAAPALLAGIIGSAITAAISAVVSGSWK